MVYANEEAILQFAKSYAPDVVVLEPKKLRDEIVKSLRKGGRGL